MNILWDKLLVETHVIVAFFHLGLNRPVYYLFPNLKDAQRFSEKLKNDSSAKKDTIQFRQIKDFFQF